MAESALCGPSNALQNFQKHTSVDRTLQQDRLTSRQSPSQSFRSSPGPNAGVLDPEFEAFQAGFAPGFPPPEFQQPHFALPPRSTSAHLPDWASDFQRLHVSQSPSPIPQFQQRPQVPMQGVAAGGWHQEFLQSQSSTRQTAMHNLTAERSYNNIGMAGYGLQGPSIHSGMSMGLAGPGPQVLQPTFQQREEIFDDAAFEQAFEQASEAANSELLAAHQESQEVLEGIARQEREDIALQETIERLNTENMAETVEQKQEPPRREDDPDELARTAGQLLDSVKDNQSQKFQESTFLSLMRRLRDREVRVEGDKMVENVQAPQSDAHTHNDTFEPKMSGAITSDDSATDHRQASA